jgi:hypothetical protein
MFQRARTLFLIALHGLAAACSTIRFTYNHGDTLLYWWLNAYVDLDSDQSDWVKKDIDKLFQWHRKTQLHDYAGLLGKMQRQLADGNPTQDELLADYREVKGARIAGLESRARPGRPGDVDQAGPDRQMERNSPRKTTNSARSS